MNIIYTRAEAKSFPRHTIVVPEIDYDKLRTMLMQM